MLCFQSLGHVSVLSTQLNKAFNAITTGLASHSMCSLVTPSSLATLPRYKCLHALCILSSDIRLTWLLLLLVSAFWTHERIL